MLIQLYWANCTLARSEANPIDSFWVEATKAEAESLIYPLCSAETITKSQTFGASKIPLSCDRAVADPTLKYCFLIAKDLSTIEAFPVYYPYSPMWQIHAAFKAIAPQRIESLEELSTISALSQLPLSIA